MLYDFVNTIIHAQQFQILHHSLCSVAHTITLKASTDGEATDLNYIPSTLPKDSS